MVRKKTKAQPKTVKKSKTKKSKLPSISPAKELNSAHTSTIFEYEYKLDADSLSVKVKSKCKTLGQYLKSKLHACNTPAARKAALFALGVCCGVVVDHLFIKCG
jgi:hypothetical protein